MWTIYYQIANRYGKIPLSHERRLIASAQRGSAESTEEIVLRHIGFIMFRLRERLYPEVLWRLGDDLLPEAILLLYDKIKTYDLRYRDQLGNRKQVRFCSYIWKRVDGFIIDYVKQEQRYVHGMDLDTLRRY